MNREHVASVIDTIDQAIADYEVSGNAMRWTPEPPTRPRPTVRPWRPVRLAVEAVGEGIRAVIVRLVRLGL